MKELLLECVNFYGENFKDTLVVPEDMQFTKFNSYFNEKNKFSEHRFYAGFYPWSKSVFDKIYKSAGNLTSVYNICNEWIFIEIWNVFPVNEDINEIPFDEFNEKWSKEMGKYVFFHKMISQKKIDQIKEKILSNTPESLLSYPEELNSEEFRVTISMSKVLNFIPAGNHLLADIERIMVKSMCNEKDTNTICSLHINFNELLPMGHNTKEKEEHFISKDKKDWDEYNNRVKEILTDCNL